MILFHTTKPDRADSIMAGGFRDSATVNKRLTATYRYGPGVWFGDVPPLDDELFDGIGLFNFDAERQAFIAVTIPVIVRWPCEGVQSSAADSTWPGTQYWAKAAIWNQFPKSRLSLDDVIRLRLADDKAKKQMRQWLKRDREYGGRGYGEEFAARVKRVLEEMD